MKTKKKQSRCQQSQQIIKSISPTYITKLTNNINNLSPQTYSTIENLFHCKKNTFLDTIQHTLLELQNNKYYKIPNYLEIFSYIIKNNEDTKDYFTLQEIKHLDTLLQQSLTLFNNDPISNKFKSFFYKQVQQSNSLTNNYPELKFHQLLINDFTSLDIILKLYHNLTHLIIYTYNYKNIKYNVYVFIDRKFNKISSHIKSFGKKIGERIFFFNNWLKTNQLPERIIIYLSDLEKELDTFICTHQYFKTNNINSAVTNKKDIVIYRKEELLKSICHELIHFHNLDTTQIPTNIIKHLQNTHNISSNNTYLLYESITETLANLFNIIFTIDSMNEFYKYLIKEILFSILQVSKILKICKYKEWDEFILEKYPKQSNKYFKQDSCVFSYYILKLYLLLNLDIYINKCLDRKLKFIPTSTNFYELLNIFNMSRLDYDLKQTINKLLKLLPNYNNKTMHKIKKIYKTLRMTCIL